MSIKLQHQESYQKKLEKLIEIGHDLSAKVIHKEYNDNLAAYSGYVEDLDVQDLAEPEQYSKLNYQISKWQKQCQHLCSKLLLENSIYSEVLDLLENNGLKGIDIQKISLNLDSILEDLKDGIFENIFLKVEAQSVINHLKQAEELFDEKQYALAGIVSLCALESFLRELATEVVSLLEKENGKNSNEKSEETERQKITWKGLIEVANFLKSKGVIDKSFAKTIHGWASIRNSIAHGNFSVNEAEIRDLIIAIKQFANSKI